MASGLRWFDSSVIVVIRCFALAGESEPLITASATRISRDSRSRLIAPGFDAHDEGHGPVIAMKRKKLAGRHDEGFQRHAKPLGHAHQGRFDLVGRLSHLVQGAPQGHDQLGHLAECGIAQNDVVIAES